MAKSSSLVYSTDASKKKCPTCGQYDCVCESVEDKPLSGQTVKIRIDRKGRKGKSVTMIEGFQVNPMHLADIAKTIKQKIGTGGTAKEGRIEIQGENRDKVAAILNDLGVKTKFSGG
jgi:translation initiation factor 1